MCVSQAPLTVLLRSASTQDLFQPNDRRSIQIRTCRQTYSGMGNKRSFIFRKCPASGIDMNVDFLDTDPRASASVPTVLTVHGAPGNYDDYAPAIAKLRARGFRVIAPNFPGTLPTP